MRPHPRRRGVVSNIDSFEHSRFKIKVPISLNKETGQFFAHYGEENFYSAKLEDIKSNLYAYIEATTGLKWIPVIEVMATGGSRTFTDVLNDDTHGDETYQRKHREVTGNLQLKAKRYYLAQLPDGEWMKCEIWDSIDYAAEGREVDHEFLASSDRRCNARAFYEANRNKDFSLPWKKAESGFDTGDTYYLPYDESVWAAFNAIGDKISELVDQLIGLVGTERGRNKLAAFAQRMLPPAPEEKSQRPLSRGVGK